MPFRNQSQLNPTTTDSFFEWLPDAAFIACTDGKLSHVNSAFVELFGFTEMEARDRCLQDLFADEAQYEHLQRQIKQAGAVREVDVDATGKGGRLLPCTATITAKRDDLGKTEAYYGILRIAADSSHVPERSDICRLPFHTLFQEAELGVYVIQDGLLRHVDAKFAQLFEYEPDELIDQFKLLDLVHPADRTKVETRLNRCLAGKTEQFQFYFRGLDKDGHKHHFRIVGRRIKTASGPILFGSLADETERWEVEAALGETQRTLSILMSNLPGMAYRCQNDEQWTVDFVSEGAYDLCGYLPAEFMHKRSISFVDIIVPEDREQVRKEVQTAVEEGRPFQITYRLQTREGEQKWVWEKGRGVRLPDGQVWIEGFITDISPLKSTEKQVYQSAARATSLATAAERLNAQLDFDAILRVMCEETAKALDVPVAILRLYDSKNDVFTIEAMYGLPHSYRQASEPLPGALHEQLFVRGPIVLSNIQQFPQLADHELYVRHDLQTVVITSIGRSGTVLGLLTAITREVRDFGEEELALMKALADHASQAITNARLYEQAQRRLRRLQALNAIDRAITSRIGLDAALATILEQVIIHLEVDAATVLLLQEQDDVLTHVADHGFRTLRLRQTQVILQDSYAGQAVNERKVIHVHELATADDFGRHALLATEEFVSYVGLPLIAEDQVIGVLEIFHRSLLNPGSEWFAFAESLATQTAVAIDNATLFLETRRLLQQTQVQAEQIRQIVDTVPEGMILLDSSSRVRVANPTGQTYLDQLAGIKVGDVLGEIGGEPLSRILTSPESVKRTYELYVQEELRLFEITAKHLRKGPGAGGWLLVIYDATEERERTRRLQAQERLVTVGQLAAGIAHDFNNILGVILLQAEALQRTPHDERDRKRLKIIDEQAQQAGRLVRQILDFSRQSVIDRHALPLLPFIKSIVELLQRALPESIQVQMVVEEDDDELYLVSGDETRLQQVLMNLAVNARDAMPHGGTLTIGLRMLQIGVERNRPLPEMTAGNWVEISVGDTGGGIPAQNIPHIFEPFFTTKARGEGTGLGLSQVYGIVRQHDGFIDVRSRPGTGTSFSIFLPSILVQRKQLTNGEAGVACAGNGETILVVEDNKSVLETLADILHLLGYKVLTAGDGEQALERIYQETGAVAAILSDVIMPRMGGMELYSILKEQYPEIPILFVTGHVPDEKAKVLLNRKEVHWIEKPFTVEKVAAAVKELIQAHTI